MESGSIATAQLGRDHGPVESPTECCTAERVIALHWKSFGGGPYEGERSIAVKEEEDGRASCGRKGAAAKVKVPITRVLYQREGSLLLIPKPRHYQSDFV